MSEEISAKLTAVYVHIKRPTGSVRFDQAVIEHIGKDGVPIEIKSKYVKKPMVAYDIHPNWKRIDSNASEIRSLVTKYTANNLQRGTYLMPTIVVPEFLIKLAELREERKKLVEDLRFDWEAALEVVRKEHKDIYEILEPRIPQPSYGNFEVAYEVYPLGTLSTEDLDLSALTLEERMLVIEETKQQAEDLFKNRVQSVFDGVFGEIMSVCEEIEKGSLDSGRRRQSGIQDILDLLKKATYFKDFADPETIRAINRASTVLENVTVQDLNANTDDIRGKIRGAFAPVRKTVEKLGKKFSQSREDRALLV